MVSDTADIPPGYETPEVAQILGLHPKTVYAIPSRLLRRTRVGPRRGRALSNHFQHKETS